MISSLSGTVQRLGLSEVVLDVGGVGFAIRATPKTLETLTLGERAALTTTLVVREDALTLYGFRHAEELEVFEALMTVSGVGPRLALTALAVLAPDAIRLAVAAGDGKALTKIPGIGPKVAGRVVLELSGKLIPPESAAAETHQAMSGKPQVVTAMVGLGWNEKEASASIDRILEDNAELRESRDVAKILRTVLRHLGQDGAQSNRTHPRG